MLPAVGMALISSASLAAEIDFKGGCRTRASLAVRQAKAEQLQREKEAAQKEKKATLLSSAWFTLARRQAAKKAESAGKKLLIVFQSPAGRTKLCKLIGLAR